MIRFTALAAASATVLALSIAVPASAGQDQIRPTTHATAQKVVMICSQDAATRRAFRREHGTRPVFVTAEQALQARASGQTWDAPRCMTPHEHGRLTQTLGAYAGVR